MLNYTEVHPYIEQQLTHQVVLLSMPQFVFGDHALADALTTHGDPSWPLCYLSCTILFLFLSRGMSKTHATTDAFV